MQVVLDLLIAVWPLLDHGKAQDNLGLVWQCFVFFMFLSKAENIDLGWEQVSIIDGLHLGLVLDQLVSKIYGSNEILETIRPGP